MNQPLPTPLSRGIVFYSTNGRDASAHLRLRAPMRQLGLSVIEGVESGKAYPERVAQGSLVVIQRDFPRDLAAYHKIMALARQNHIPAVYDLDALLLSLPETHPDRIARRYTDALLPVVLALHEADCVTVATPALKAYLSAYRQDIVVLPDLLDDALWPLREPAGRTDPGAPIIIGMTGSEANQPDLKSIAPVLANLLDRFTQAVEFHFWGIKPPSELARYPQVKWTPARALDYAGHARFLQSLPVDVFISPWIDNPYNRAQSARPFLEIAALGMPGVYSRITPFVDVVDDEVTGLLAATAEEWQQALTRLIEDEALRLQLASGAQRKVRSNWLISSQAGLWRAAYEQVIQAQQPSEREEQPALMLTSAINSQYRELLDEKDQALRDKDEMAQSLSYELAEIKVSKTYKMALLFRKLRLSLAPIGSRRAKLASFMLHRLQGERTKFIRRRKPRSPSAISARDNEPTLKAVVAHPESIDVIVCVHNALADVRNCLESVMAHTKDPFSLIVVDDGSDEPTRDFLLAFAASDPHCRLIRNEQAKGYTLAANIGMRASQAPYLVLLNSDTIVGPEWLDRLYRAMASHAKVGVAGPLSNTASWQSIPKLSDDGDWATNPLPPGKTAADMSRLVTRYSGCILPEVPLLNGFCLMIRKALIDEIGYFDVENFGQGYGEEDDFSMRAEDAGWKKVIVDDVYIFHAQSKSYSSSRRHTLSKVSGEKLRRKHGSERIAEHVAFMNPNRVMEGIRSRAEVMLEREECISTGRNVYSGKKVLFVVPVIDAGGGANVIIDEARTMLQMGVDVSIYNLSAYKAPFLENYPHLDIPVVFGSESDLPKQAAPYDAVVVSANYSVPWLKPLQGSGQRLGYYVQGFEPLMYPAGSEQARQALATYTMIEGCRLFTKTEWTRAIVSERAGVNPALVGISVNIDLFRPRDMVTPGKRPVDIVAMVRPMSPYRNPVMTLEILKTISKRFGSDVNIWLFGANDVREVVDPKYLDFRWKQLGKLTQPQVAALMSKADIFTDFSTHQAMGLSALEAISSGCAVIVPRNGGAIEFITHRENGIVADTSSQQESLRALEELVADDALRRQLQIAGIWDVTRHFPEKASYQILSTLFGS